MTEQSIIQFWLDTAQNDQNNALASYANKHYDWAFFQWHLAIEKLFKGIIAKSSHDIPHIHDLVKLASITNLSIPSDILNNLEEINTYNINARYDDYKRTFYHKVTKPKYYLEWHKKCQTTFSWLLKKN